MEICSGTKKLPHEEIVFHNEKTCPVCDGLSKIDTLEDKFADKEEECKNLQKQVDSLEEEKENLSNEIIRLKGG